MAAQRSIYTFSSVKSSSLVSFIFLTDVFKGFVRRHHTVSLKSEMVGEVILKNHTNNVITEIFSCVQDFLVFHLFY